MGRLAVQKLPGDLEQLYKSLKSLNCSAKWNWEKLIELLQPGNQGGNAFLGMCEAGIFHIMYSKSSYRDCGILCKKLHTSDFELMHSVGTCYSLHLLFGAASNRIDKFKESLEQIVSTLLDALITALKVSDFDLSMLQPLTALQNTEVSVLPRLLPIGETTVKNVLDLALCRTYILSSALRGIFECGSAITLPICLPYLCSVISAMFSVNICDARRSSFALMSCARHLLHTFSIIVQSCGINISPAAPCLITSMVYQLEWSSSFAQSHPSKESLSYKLAVYRCISSLLGATARVASPALCRLVHRLIAEVCLDISFPAKEILTQTLMNNGDDLTIFELRICCTVASFCLLELLFVNHHFILSHSLSESSNVSEDFSNRNSFDYKLKHAMLLLSSEMNRLASRLVTLLNKSTRLSPVERVLIRPHFLLPFLNTSAAVIDYGFLFSRSGALYHLTRTLLAHSDPTLRLVAERCFRHTFKALKSETWFSSPSFSDEKSLASSFTQTETPECFVQIDNTTTAPAAEIPSKSVSTEEQSTSRTSTFIDPAICESFNSVDQIEVNKIPDENSQTSVFCKTADPLNRPNKRGKKRVRFEDSTQNSTKKPRPNSEKFAEVSSLAKLAPTPGKSDEDMPSLEDALGAFDDTLI
ncbi:hypothetical protein Aperf_G00000021144 [Anoplocephala perfoliata]